MAEKENWTPASDRAWDNLSTARLSTDTRTDCVAYEDYLAVAVVSDLIFLCRHYPDKVKKWLDEIESLKEQVERREGPNLAPAGAGYSITGISFPLHLWFILWELSDYPGLDLTDIPAVHEIIKPHASTQGAKALADFIALFRKELGDQEADNIRTFLDPYPTEEQWQRVAVIKMVELSMRQRQRKLARNPRPDALQNVIAAIVKEDPAITAPQLLVKLQRKAGLGGVIESVRAGEIEWTDDKGSVRDTPAHVVKDRLSRAKKALGLTRRKSR
jgi:hypothetical protein